MDISLVAYLLMFNGMYDVFCSVLLIFQGNGPHKALFAYPPDDPAVIRFMGYWIFTYGWIRLLCGLLWSNDPILKYFAVSSFLIECMGFEYELYKSQAMSRKAVAFVSALCIVIILFIQAKYYNF